MSDVLGMWMGNFESFRQLHHGSNYQIQCPIRIVRAFCCNAMAFEASLSFQPISSYNPEINAVNCADFLWLWK